MHCDFVTGAKLVLNTAKSSATQQGEISAQADGTVTISNQEIQTSASSRAGKSFTADDTGTHCTLDGKKANVTAAKWCQLCYKIINAQHTKRNNFSRALVKVIYDKGKAQPSKQKSSLWKFLKDRPADSFYKSCLKHQTRKHFTINVWFPLLGYSEARNYRNRPT